VAPWYFPGFYTISTRPHTSNPHVQAAILKIMGFSGSSLGVFRFPHGRPCRFVISTKGAKVESRSSILHAARVPRIFVMRQGKRGSSWLAEANVLPEPTCESFAAATATQP